MDPFTFFEKTLSMLTHEPAIIGS